MAASLLVRYDGNGSGLVNVTGSDLSYVESLLGPAGEPDAADNGSAGKARAWARETSNANRWIVSRKALQALGLVPA